jgi:two-component system, chemotaxis family, protein-glutamate methylesterase/glutaminase
VLEKPRGDADDDQWGARLRAAVRLISRIRVIRHPRARLAGPPPGPVPPVEGMSQPEGDVRVVAVGASTGGPGALTELLRGLPPGFRTPVLCVQHFAASEPFAVAFTDWLAGQTGRAVGYARDGAEVAALAGRVVLAPPDRHLRVSGGVLRLDDGPPRHNCRPAVDVLFESVADEYGPHAAGCLLTGMGRDGAHGLLRMRARGAATFAQDEASCVVYGMPREAALLGAAALALPPGCMAVRLGALVPTTGARR